MEIFVDFFSWWEELKIFHRIAFKFWKKLFCCPQVLVKIGLILPAIDNENVLSIRENPNGTSLHSISHSQFAHILSYVDIRRKNGKLGSLRECWQIITNEPRYCTCTLYIYSSMSKSHKEHVILRKSQIWQKNRHTMRYT